MPDKQVPVNLVPNKLIPDKEMLDKQNFVKFDLGSEHAFNAPLKIVKTANGQMWFFYKDHLLLQNGSQRQIVSFAKHIKKQTADSVRVVAVEMPQGMFFAVERSLFYIPFDTLKVEPVAFNDVYIMSLSVTANGTLWVITLNDIYQSPALQTPFTKVPTPKHVPRTTNNRLNALQSMTLSDNKILVSTAMSTIFSIEQTEPESFVFKVFGFKKQQKFDAIYQVAL
ncbi:MAG: hypothetical protein MJK04_36240, partial [Psychrosphaera sp.]|nr:hypothetical protein [Psychrosphaera sp.]